MYETWSTYPPMRRSATRLWAMRTSTSSPAPLTGLCLFHHRQASASIVQTKQLQASQLPPNSPADRSSPRFCRPATQSRLFQSAAITNHNPKAEMSSLPTSQAACLEFRENGVDMLAQAEKKMLSMKPAFVSPEVDSTPRQQRLVLQK